MVVSVFDIFKVGIGPSSSHTVGPMKAARRFLVELEAERGLADLEDVRVELFGSLAATGRGHGSDVALLLGLEGETPDGVDIDGVDARLDRVAAEKTIRLLGQHTVPFTIAKNIAMRRKSLPRHPNGIRFTAIAGGLPVAERVFYSIGGGFVVDEHEASADRLREEHKAVPHPFGSGDALLAQCRAKGMSIAELALANEAALRPDLDVRARLLEIWAVMQACVERGCERDGVLPGALKVQRRAASMRRRLIREASSSAGDVLSFMDWVNLWALAVNEENASRGRVVTAPTNGAAGIIPAVLHHYVHHRNGDDDGVVRFLLTAGAIGSIYIENASISGAEVGCQGEVGVACSMAAGGLVGALRGTIEQVENAAEIGMEHNLGLTCDPVGGLVQVPCIERNAMGAVKAINAARLAVRGDGTHKVSLDRVIETMRQTGADMKTKYKETSRGGLAVHITEC